MLGHRYLLNSEQALNLTLNADSQKITKKVKEFYQYFPYPAYPVLLRPPLQEAYLSTSIFNSVLARDCHQMNCGVGRYSSKYPNSRVTILGCGDTQPYIFNKLEPRNHHLTFVDLSQKNLARAKFRSMFTFNRASWIQTDLSQYLLDVYMTEKSSSYAHIDAYGVLHHLSNSQQALYLISKNLLPNGTLRLMLYNSKARSWINLIQNIFKKCELSPYDHNDRIDAKKILNKFAYTPQLKRQFIGIGKGIFNNDSRLVDTFFHVREVISSIEKWFELISNSGLLPYGLFDRYCELDDLSNPLWKIPHVHELEERASDRRFENNLEIFLIKKPTEPKNERKLFMKKNNSFLFHIPPRNFFNFSETQDISFLNRWIIWKNFLSYTHSNTVHPKFNVILEKTETIALQRLARIGAILPGMITNYGLYEKLVQPIEQCMEPPQYFKSMGEIPRDILNDFKFILLRKKLYKNSHINYVTKMLAQLFS